MGGYIYNEREKFGSGASSTPRVFMVWGLKKQDLNECGFAELECDGSANYAETINLEDEAKQNKLKVRKTFYGCTRSERVFFMNDINNK